MLIIAITGGTLAALAAVLAGVLTVLTVRSRRRKSRAPEPIKLPGVKYHL